MSDKEYIQIECSEDLIEAGITYITRHLGQLEAPDYDHLRQVVVDKIVELAFRRLLTDRDVPHQAQPSTSFTQRDHFDLTIGGRRCSLISRLMRKKEDIAQIHKNPNLLDQEQIFHSVQEFGTKPHEEDLYIFAFLTGLVTRSQQDLGKAIDAGQPTFLLNPMPRSWVYPANWSGLGELTLKSDASESAVVTLGGLNAEKEFITQQVNLDPQERTPANDDFYGLSYIHSHTLPDGKIGIHSPVSKDTVVIERYDWGNLYVYGMKIFFVGYLSVGEFNRQAKRFETGKYTGDLRVGKDTMAVQVDQLRPLPDLFVRANNWEQQKDR